MKPKSKNASSTTTSTHPKVSEMVLLAIAILNDRNGSSIQAIKKYISKSFNVDEKKISSNVKRYLILATASGTLVRTKGKGAAGSFRLGGCMKFKMSELLSELPEQMPEKSVSPKQMSVKSASPSKRKGETSTRKTSKKAKKSKPLTNSIRAV